MITSIIKCEMKSLIHSQTSLVQPLEFQNGWVISSILYWAYDYLSMQGLELIHVSKTGPWKRFGCRGCSDWHLKRVHYNDVIMSLIASQITSLTIVHSTVYSDAAQRKHQSSASLAFVWGIHRGPVNSPHKWPVTQKMFPFGDVFMTIHVICEQIVLPDYEKLNVIMNLK